MKNKYRIFWTCILPENLIAKYSLSFAACNFSFNLMSGGGFDKVYSMMPLYVGGKMDEEASCDSRFELIYDRLRLKVGIGQKLAIFKEQWTIFKKIPRNASLWLYNINTLNAFLFILLKVFKPSVQLNVIVLDFTPVEKGFGLNNIYLNLINMANGRICLADSPLFKHKNAVILPGVIPLGYKFPIISNIQKKFLLSGVLTEEIAQTTIILKAFANLPDCELYITGTRGDETLLKYYDNSCHNIHWLGQLPYSEYTELLHSVTFQLSTRDASFPENKCNFPSKILEALHHNRIVISTILYPQIAGISYFEIKSDANGLLGDIRDISEMPSEKLIKYANQGNKVQEMFNVNIWNMGMEQLENNIH